MQNQKEQIRRSMYTPLVYNHALLLVILGADITHKQMKALGNNVLTFRAGANLNAGPR
jgi:hypothetical protein